MTHNIALLSGDGIGPEMIVAAQRVVEATGVSVSWHPASIGAVAFKQHKSPVPDETLETIRRCGVALKGFTETPIGGGYESPNVVLRKRLNLFAATRPIKNLAGLPARYQDIDLVVVRELTEDLYAGIEHRVTNDVVMTMKIVTEKACDRISRFAFNYAKKFGRKKVTVVHKANIMKKADGLFLQCARNVAAQNTDIAFSEVIVDNACMQLITNPYQFDVLLLGNLYGDIVSDLCAGLIGGVSAVASASQGEDIAIFEAMHGNVPHLVGTGRANPLTQIMPAIYMLRHIGETSAAERLLQAVSSVLTEKKSLTPDLGGDASTAQMIEAIVTRLKVQGTGSREQGTV
jgi:isocitrate dehydrogenase (NAD+)